MHPALGQLGWDGVAVALVLKRPSWRPAPVGVYGYGKILCETMIAMWRARTPAGMGGAPGPLLGWAALGVPTGDCLVSGRFWVSVIPAVPRASPAGVGGAGVAWGAYRPVRRPVENGHSLGPWVLDWAPLREASANASCIPDLPWCNGVGPPRVTAG